MLPFLKRQIPQTGIATTYRKPDAMENVEQEDQIDNSALEAAAKDIARAIAQDDHKKLAEALRSAFQILDAEPHYEGEHLEDEQE